MKSSEIKLHGEYAVKDGYIYKRAIVVDTKRYARRTFGPFVESAGGEYIAVDLFHLGDAKPTRRYFRPNAFASTWTDFTASEARQRAEAEVRRRVAEEKRRSEGHRLDAVRSALRAAGVETCEAHGAFEPRVMLTLEQAEVLVRKLGITRSS